VATKNQIESKLLLDASQYLKALSKSTKAGEETSKKSAKGWDKTNERVVTFAAKIQIATAALRAMSGAFEFAKQGEKALNAWVGFEKVVGNTTESMGALRTASANLISDTDLQVMATKMRVMGLSVDDTTRVMSTGLKAVLASTGDATQGMDRLAKAIATGEAETLKGLGVLINLNDEYKIYAESIGKTAIQLTEQEKLQVRLTKITGRLADAYADVPLEGFKTGLQRADAALKNAESAAQEFGATIINWVVTPLMDALTELKELNAFAESMAESSVGKLTTLQDKYADISAKRATLAAAGMDTAVADKALVLVWQQIKAQSKLVALQIKGNEANKITQPVVDKATESYKKMHAAKLKAAEATTSDTLAVDASNEAYSESDGIFWRVGLKISGMTQNLEVAQMVMANHAEATVLAASEAAAAIELAADIEIEKSELLSAALAGVNAERARAVALAWEYADAARSVASAAIAITSSALGEEKSAKERAALIIAEASLNAIWEGALSVKGFLGGNIPLGIAHAALAVKFAAIGAMNANAVINSGVAAAGGGGGGGGAAVTSAVPAAISTPELSPQGDTGGPQSINVYVTGPTLSTKKDIEGAVGAAVSGWAQGGGRLPASVISINSTTWED